jgi:hypothetical protein
MLKTNARGIFGVGACLTLALAAAGCSGAQPEDEAGTSQTELKKADPQLAHYQETYSRWEFGDKTLPTDQYGNAVEKNIVMLPVPPTPGDGTPGTAAVTLAAGEGFTVPFFVEFGTSYRDGTPPDPFEPLSIFTTLEIKVTLDGKTLVTPDNVLSYFSKFTFDPAIPYADPVIEGIIWYEGVALLQNPLPAGEHVLTLDEKNTEPGFGGILEYHNTWNLTVQPGR